MRSLVLAGGGMRVAWQSGVVKALHDAGITFDHVDGTSGGIMTTGMLLSGLTPEEMCERWSSLDVHDFSSPLDVSDYLTGPWNLPGIGDADGIIRKVFPHLGIEPATIQQSAVSGTFNVADFVTKTCVPVPHTDVDAELLAAGMSLPLFMPPLRRGEHVWTDAVWIKDANVAEAVRRGADEVWLVWCIGNTPYWGDGPLEQYVHMIEMSAGGGLVADLQLTAASGREFVLHVVKPEYPLPLDPEFFAGRITASSLVDMGYRDAQAYLDTRSDGGVPHEPACTAMTDPPPGVRFRQQWHGELEGAPLGVELTVELPEAGDHGVPTRVAGHLQHEPWGGRVPLAGGAVETSPGTLTVRANARIDGAWVPVALTSGVSGGLGWEDWLRPDDPRLTVGQQAAEVRVRVRDSVRTVLSVEPFGVHGVTARAALLARMGVAGSGFDG
jgi:predicted acylesterase/phospholipase RssA